MLKENANDKVLMNYVHIWVKGNIIDDNKMNHNNV